MASKILPSIFLTTLLMVMELSTCTSTQDDKLEALATRMTQLEAELQVKTTQSIEEIGLLKNQLGLAFQEINRLKEKLDNVADIKNHFLPLLNSPKPLSTIPRTCYEIKSSQTSYIAGIYKIDPSGLGKDSITVYCDSDGKTLISHDSETPSFISNCLGPDCYTRAITYDAKFDQMMSLTKISSECRQSFRYDCTVAPFEYNGVQYSFWKDAHGNIKNYWAGPKSDTHTCQCGIDRNCFNIGITCNCDGISSTPQVDEGFISDRGALPVRELHFGRSQLSGSSGKYALGKLECSGRSTFNGLPTGCIDLYQIGHVLNGFYPVKNGNKIDMIFCDFGSIFEEAGFENRVGFIEIKSSTVHFYVQRNTMFNTADVVLPFEVERLNLGGAMNLATGIFTVPVAGVYHFEFSALKDASATHLNIDFQINGSFITRAHMNHGTTGTLERVSLSASFHLKQNDRVGLYNSYGVIFDGSAHDTHFTGWLVEEDLSI